MMKARSKQRPVINFRGWEESELFFTGSGSLVGNPQIVCADGLQFGGEAILEASGDICM